METDFQVEIATAEEAGGGLRRMLDILYVKQETGGRGEEEEEEEGEGGRQGRDWRSEE